MLRLSKPRQIESVASEIVLFQNRYVPKVVYLTSFEKPILDIKVDSLSGLEPDEEAQLKPSVGAVKLETSNVNGFIPEITDRYKEKRKVAPAYPQMAKERRMSGTIVIDAVIGKDGRVIGMTPVSSRDPLFTASAMEAVSKWEYVPFQVDGEVVEASILITVIFNLGG